MVRQPVESRANPEEEPLVVNSDPTDPAVPLDLSLTVRRFAEGGLLEITARVGKHLLPAELFFDKGVKATIQLPEGLELQEGSLTWRGDLRGEEVGQFQAKVKAVRDLEATVDASARGRRRGRPCRRRSGAVLRARQRENGQVSLNPFTASRLSKPGATEEGK